MKLWVPLALAVFVVAAPTVSGAEPAPTCKAMCRRLTDCKMPSYTKLCLDSCKQYRYEASEAGRAQLRVLTRYTCKQIQAAVAGGQSATPTAPARTPSRAESDDDDDDEAELDPAPPRGAGRPAGGRRPAQSGPQGSVPSGGGGPAASGIRGCSPVCGRISQCGLMAFDRCDQLCEGAASNGHHWEIVRNTCSEIKKGFVSDEWLCRAEASIGLAVGSGPFSYSTELQLGNGKTRDQAANLAMKNCNEMLSERESVATLGEQRVDAGTCQVTQCTPPGSPLK